MINPAYHGPIGRFLRTGVVIALLILVTTAFGQEKTTPKTDQEPVDKKTEPVVDNRDCDLSPAEQIVVSQLRKAIEGLEARRLRMKSKETALLALQKQVGEDMKKLRNLQKKIANELDAQAQKRVDDRNARIDQLANLIKKMRAENAALILAATEDDLAVETLDRLGERRASKLLEALPTERAVTLANKLLDLPIKKKEKK